MPPLDVDPLPPTAAHHVERQGAPLVLLQPAASQACSCAEKLTEPFNFTIPTSSQL